MGKSRLPLHLEELLQRASDLGEFPGSERAALEELLREPEQAARHADLTEAARALRSLPALRAPEGFAATVSSSIAQDAAVSRLRASSLLAPPDFARSVMERIQEAQHAEAAAALQELPRVPVPEGFAAHVARRIARDAHRQEVHNPAPLYLFGGVLAAGGVAIASLFWPHLRTGADALADLLNSLPPEAAGVYLLLLAVGALALLLQRVRFVAPAALGAFAVAGVLLLPGVSANFGPGTLAAGQTSPTLLRVGGDVRVAGTVHGDVITLGGSVVLEPGARVTGEVISLLGDVRGASEAALSDPPTAILGHVEGQTAVPQGRPLARVGAASAFQPLLELARSEYWPALNFALLCILTLLLYQSGHLSSMRRSLGAAPARHLLLGLLLLLIGVPAAVIAGLSVIGAPAALLLILGLFALQGAGLALLLTSVGNRLTVWLRLPQHPVSGAALGLTLFLVTLPFPLIATALWLIGGALGSGALLTYLRRFAERHRTLSALTA
ncbi:hypothetical protein HNR42_002394 [Deinobacterium chartae]|uniref:Polymer-forming cytoskeletal protein n=1 Tax=Deinobacterium chartae TaxID=521158 RepID=A0A841I3R1_9DEIO|nr:polymer-forming cytoskeletal protein [Deinobacterium chartae]MBB6098959.1 hypothetical protein [Deinobacterium chartae]